MKFSANAGQRLDVQAFAFFEALWTEGLSDLPDSVLEAAFRKALQTCKFWPVKVADIREHVDRTEETARNVDADRKWQDVLEYCREFVSPDVPIPSYAPRISERTMTAVRAAGGLFWIESCSTENLVWAKKSFIESYNAWETLRKDRFLLPDGEVKKLLAECSHKMLPPPQAYDSLRERGEQYRATMPKLERRTRPVIVWESPEQREQILAEVKQVSERIAAAYAERKKAAQLELSGKDRRVAQ